MSIDFSCGNDHGNLNLASAQQFFFFPHVLRKRFAFFTRLVAYSKNPMEFLFNVHINAILKNCINLHNYLKK